MDFDECTAREGIRDTLARYNLSGDRGDMEGLLDCFASDAVLEIEGEPAVRGRDAIARRMRAAVSELDRATGDRPSLVRHHLTTTGIEIEGPGSARAWSYFLVVTEAGLDHAGRYRDELRLEDERWRLARRRVRVEWQSPDSRYGRRVARSRSGQTDPTTGGRTVGPEAADGPEDEDA